jgi:hypothetical protein
VNTRGTRATWKHGCIPHSLDERKPDIRGLRAMIFSENCPQHFHSNSLRNAIFTPILCEMQLLLRKVYITTQLFMVDYLTSPQNYKTRYSIPWTFQNRSNNPLSGFGRWFCNSSTVLSFLFYLFPLNLLKIILNHRKNIKWKIQFCWTPRE